MRDDVYVLERPVWHEEPELVVGVLASLRARRQVPEQRQVRWIDASHDFVDGGRRRAIESVDAAHLVRPLPVVGDGAPGEASRVTQSLGFGEMRFTLAQLLRRLPPLRDVGDGADELRW